VVKRNDSSEEACGQEKDDSMKKPSQEDYRGEEARGQEKDDSGEGPLSRNREHHQPKEIISRVSKKRKLV
jgi:hypothetical protein